MDLSKIPVGVNPPYDVNAIIEIPQGGEPVKYEIDKESGALFVDRFLHTAMFYPGNYGFIPHTLADDGDPMDIMVVGQTPVVPGAIIRARPIGTLMMTDEAGGDEKVLAVPVDALHPYHSGISSWRQLPAIMTEQIAHFFQHYKDLEKGKSTRITGWADPEEVADLIRKGMERAQEAAAKPALIEHKG
ncbi:MAG TPA: inorganic diphosphatase [Phenylobacterium sp.]